MKRFEKIKYDSVGPYFELEINRLKAHEYEADTSLRMKIPRNTEVYSCPLYRKVLACASSSLGET